MLYVQNSLFDLIYKKIVSYYQFKVFKLKHNNYLNKCNTLNISNIVYKT